MSCMDSMTPTTHATTRSTHTVNNINMNYKKLPNRHKFYFLPISSGSLNPQTDTLCQGEVNLP
jgi:hypothetical protein